MDNIVAVTNLIGGYSFKINTNSSYPEILQRRMKALEEWTQNHSLESATKWVNQIIPEPKATLQEVNLVVFGPRGLVTSTKQSLSPQGNPYNPHKNKRLEKKKDSPFLLDREGHLYLRGEVKGQYPHPMPNNHLGLIRRTIEIYLELPIYTRYRVHPYDHIETQEISHEIFRTR